jgi:hypothetical protein
LAPPSILQPFQHPTTFSSNTGKTPGIAGRCEVK